VNLLLADIKAGSTAHCYCYIDPDVESRKAGLFEAAAELTSELPLVMAEKANVSEIADVLAQLAKPALSGNLRILLVPFACKISVLGQNKLLKTLEEPPPNTVVLLGAEKADLLLVTVLSRAKKVWAKSLEAGKDLSELRQLLESLKSSKDVPALAKTLPEGKAEMLEFVAGFERVICEELFKNCGGEITYSALQDVAIWARERLLNNVSPQAVAEAMLLKIVEVRHFTR
jgi:hypothetical protein